ncbi:MAG TPA: aspartate aminotransferase family protein [Solirubrobacterales bacterium]|nr:aspartate aminotransferase family protein [Solirubrobacterales bacterium]
MQRDAMQTALREHLVLGFTQMKDFVEQPVPILERGEGCYVFDDAGDRYIDGLSGLYCVALGHSHGDELGQAALAQMGALPYASNFSSAHPRSIELATRLAGLAPEGLEHVFFASGGSEAVETAWKLALQYHRANGEPQRRTAIARKRAYHGVTLGALSLTGIESVREAFQPTAISVRHVSNTNPYRHPAGEDPELFCRLLLEEIEEVILEEGPENVAMLIAEPVQNAGGSIVPPPGYWQGVREICDRHGILLCLDEVICAFGRLGHWFGADRFGVKPDLLTFAKGLTGGHFPLGGVLVSNRVAGPLLDGRADFLHGFTFGGHPTGCAVALAALDVFERENVCVNVRENEPYLAELLEGLREIPIVGDVRGMGYLWSVEIVRDKASGEKLEGEEAKRLLADVLSAELWERGLICRLDSRADSVITLAPPLVADRAILAEIATILRGALETTAARVAELPAVR